MNEKKRPECLTPSTSLLCKLGSVVVHIDEATGPGGHPFDKRTLEALLVDPEVVGWLAAMRKLALVPEKRQGSRTEGAP
jgi:hypothetical protein